MTVWCNQRREQALLWGSEGQKVCQAQAKIMHSPARKENLRSESGSPTKGKGCTMSTKTGATTDKKSEDCAQHQSSQPHNQWAGAATRACPQQQQEISKATEHRHDECLAESL